MTEYSYDKKNKFLDVTAPAHVEIITRKDKKVIWINIDGICAVRICRIEKLELDTL